MAAAGKKQPIVVDGLMEGESTVFQFFMDQLKDKDTKLKDQDTQLVQLRAENADLNKHLVQLRAENAFLLVVVNGVNDTMKLAEADGIKTTVEEDIAEKKRLNTVNYALKRNLFVVEDQLAREQKAREAENQAASSKIEELKNNLMKFETKLVEIQQRQETEILAVSKLAAELTTKVNNVINNDPTTASKTSPKDESTRADAAAGDDPWE